MAAASFVNISNDGSILSKSFMSFLPIFKLSTKVFTPPYIAVNGADKLLREIFISSSAVVRKNQ